jgi:hypothetical protein
MEVKAIMTYRQIEASREARLWITQVIVPTLLMAGVVVTANPELKKTATAKFEEVKRNIKRKLHK